MAVEPWNKVNIPRPDATTSCRIRFNLKTAKVTEDVVLHCENVLKLLKSEVLLTEIQLLYKMLYVVNNSFRQHKTFHAIKQEEIVARMQILGEHANFTAKGPVCLKITSMTFLPVEQCIGRLSKMKLQEALEGLQELCPSNILRDVGVDVGQCNVPSQPILEWFSLKLLGASSLLSRTLDQCSKAFLLTKQHLYLSEFIVLNLVLVSMLSRLWVFFRGILMTLVPLYTSIINLLRDVVACHPMAFLTDFTLPIDIPMFLGPAYSNLPLSQPKFFGIKEVTKHSLLDSLFEKEAEEEVEKADKKDLTLILDNNLKLKQVEGLTKPNTAEAFIKASLPELSTSECLNVVEMTKFLKQLKTASNLGDMEDHIKEMMGWCRRCKLHQEHRLLTFTLLRCRKMKTVECEGLSVQKRLRRLCLWLHRVLLIRRSQSSHSHFVQWKTRTRFPTLMARYGSIRNRLVGVKMCRRVSRDLYDERTKSSKKCKKNKKYIKVSALLAGMSKSGDTFSTKKTKMEKPKLAMNHSEIDDIFSCIV